MQRSLSMRALKVLVVALAMSVTASAPAAESAPLAYSAYRLSVEKSAAFRLAGKELDVLAPAPRKESAAAVWLADKPYAKLIESAARQAAIDPSLVHAVISVESAYNPAARSPKGAIGLMQLMPETAARYGVTDAGRSPEVNLQAGTRYLSDLMKLFDNRVDLALAAYNAGENAVLRYGRRIPPYAETQHYVPAVLANYHKWREPLTVVAPAPTRIQYMPGTSLDLGLLRTDGYR